MVNVKGGHVGIDGIPRWTDADSVRKVIVKPKKLQGGDIINYSYFLTGEEKAGKGFSIKKMIANIIADTSGTNNFTRTVCGYDPSIDPLQVTSWTNVPVKYTLGKIKAKGGLVEGTFVLKKQPKKKKITGIDNADWIIDGILE